MDSSELQSSVEEIDFVPVLKYEFSSNSCVRHYKSRLKALNGSGRPDGCRYLNLEASVSRAGVGREIVRQFQKTKWGAEEIRS